MSTYGITVTILATGLAKAVLEDEANGEGFDLSAGLFGENVSEWIREVAAELDKRKEVKP